MARTRRQQRKKSQSRKRRGGGRFSHLNPRKWTPSKWRANPLRMGRDYITARNAGIREGYMLRTDCTADEAKVVAAEVAAVAAREEDEMGARYAQLDAEAKGDTVQSVGGRRRRNRRSQRRQSKRGGRRSQRRQRRRRN